MIVQREIRSSRGLLSVLMLLQVFGGAVGAAAVEFPAEPLIWSRDGEEGRRDARFTILSRTEGAQFRYETVGGTARAGVDYIPVSGTGSNSVDVEIILSPDDGKVEPPRTVKLIVIEEGPGFIRTNRAELVIYDNELPRGRDLDFSTYFYPIQRSYAEDDLYKVVSGRVLADGRLVIVEPLGFTIVNEEGRVEVRHIFPEWKRKERWRSAVTPEGDVILGRAVVRPGVDSALVKFRANGEHDVGFGPPLPALSVHGLTVTPEGKILVGYTHTNETDWRVVRLNPDGSPDSSFLPVQREWEPFLRIPDLYQHIGIALDGRIQIITPEYLPRRLILNEEGKVIEEAIVHDATGRPRWPAMWAWDGTVLSPRGSDDSIYGYSLHRFGAYGALDEDFVPAILPARVAYLGTQRDGKVLAFVDGELIRFHEGPEATNHVWITNLSGGEEDPDAYMILERTGDTTMSRTVRIQTEDSTAKAGLDYEYMDAMVTFKPLASTATVRLKMIDDNLSEGPEYFNVKVSSPSDDVQIETPEFRGWIFDQEGYMQVFVQRNSDGTLSIWEGYEPDWTVSLQVSGDLGRTWADLGISTNRVWSITPDAEVGTRIYRAVKVD